MIGTLRGIMVLAAASLFVAALAALVLALAGASIGLYLAVRGLGRTSRPRWTATSPVPTRARRSLSARAARGFTTGSWS